MNKKSLTSLLVLGVLLLQGCATYTTPSAGVNISSIGDADISDLFSVEPASPFPARVAVARVQASGYVSRTNQGFGSGRYSVVTTRDVEKEADFEKFAALEKVAAVAPLNRLLLPKHLSSIKDLRLASARLKADMVLVYSIDTSFDVQDTPLGPLTAITLGFLPNKKAFVSATTSAALIDVRTGYIYGVAEATKREQQRASTWNKRNAIDRARLAAESESFKSLMVELETLWKSVTNQYVSTAPRGSG